MSAEIQGSPEWHEARRLPEPASSIAALTGEQALVEFAPSLAYAP